MTTFATPRRKRVARLAAGTAAASLAVALGTAAPALANSFSGSDAYASWSYSDSSDNFCVTSKDGSVSVKLSPVTAGRGPSYNSTVSDGKKKCFSLATAYEDSKYNWFVGTRGAPHSGTFYS